MQDKETPKPNSTPQGPRPFSPQQLAALSAQVKYYFLSQCLRSRVRFEGEKKPFGRLYDIGAQNTPSYPYAVCLQVKAGWRQIQTFPWSAVLEFSPKSIVLKKDVQGSSAVDTWLRKDVLDDQIIDISGSKVLRVNDVHMLHAEGRLVVVHVDVGILGIVRRLGYERIVGGLLNWLFDYTLHDGFVSWRHVQLVGSGGWPGPLRVSAGPSKLAEIHPAELADIVEQLGVAERHTVFRNLSLEMAADTLEEVDPDVQRSLISQVEPGKAADILEEMPATEAADVLRDLHDTDAQRIINRMETEAAADVKTILAHEEKSAGGIMATSCIETRPEQKAGDVLEYVRSVAHEVEVFNQIYVLDAGRHLIGVMSLRELMRASINDELRGLMTSEVVKVGPQTELEEVARIFLKYGFRAIPVVDDDNVFRGAVRLINVLGKLTPFLKD